EAARAGRVSRHVQLLVQRQRGDVPGRRRRRRVRRARDRVARRKADAGTRSSDSRECPRDVLPEVPDSEKGGVMRTIAVMSCAAVTFVTGSRAGVPALQQNDPRVAAALEPIRARHHFPALGGAIVTSKGVSAMAVTGVRKADTDVAARPDDLW